MTKDEALRMALEALMEHGTAYLGHSNEYQQAIIKSKEALAQPSDSVEPIPEQLAALGWQSIECPFCGSSGARAFPKPEQEPVAYLCENAGVAHHKQAIKREWVGLTDGKIDAVTTAQWGVMSGQPLAAHRAYARAIEAELKELNHG